MNPSLFLSLSRLALVLETVEHNEALRSQLEREGYRTDAGGDHDAAHRILDEGLAAIDKVLEHWQADTTAVHLIHAGATELEQWFDSALFRARKLDTTIRERLDGHDIHHPDHTLTVIARTLRFVAILRNDAELRDQLGSARSVHDLLQRGNVLLVKLLRLANGAVSPREHREAVAETILPPTVSAAAWYERFSLFAAKALHHNPRALGRLGILTDDALALGGTAYSVTRHERTARQAPSDGPSPPDPGWSIGRQGRNRENTGGGYH